VDNHIDSAAATVAAVGRPIVAVRQRLGPLAGPSLGCHSNRFLLAQQAVAEHVPLADFVPDRLEPMVMAPVVAA